MRFDCQERLGHMIPPFNHSGVLPPFIGHAHERHGRSPYPVSLKDIASRFAGSEPRKSLFDGFLRYRNELRSIGLSGFQWLDGSFVEDVETMRRRPPGDIDVVTFAKRPEGVEADDSWEAFVRTRLDLFVPSEAKRLYHCDAYFVDLHSSQPEWLVKLTSYWSGLFSHQRDTSLWKGMVQVSLEQDPDVEEKLEDTGR